MNELFTILVFGFGFIALIILILCILSKRCFDDTNPSMFPYDNYALPSKGYGNSHPVTPPDCQHTGEKTNVVKWVTTTCEQVHLVCDDCGKTLDIKIDC